MGKAVRLRVTSSLHGVHARPQLARTLCIFVGVKNVWGGSTLMAWGADSDDDETDGIAYYHRMRGGQ